jgi:ubiquinol-cytochrome c reductase cytochrome b subunit
LAKEAGLVDIEPRLDQAGGAIDDRFRVAKTARRALRKVFPDHWSFFLGELALYSFIILLLTGTYLTFFFKPSMQELVYHGSYVKLDGVTMSQAYASTLNISFDVRGGLLVRQIHHWAALVFIAAIAVHALRIFFTGAFRKPRELNWVIGTTMFALACVEGFAGYSLPDDLLSGTGLRIAEGIMLSVPIVGTYLSFFLFGGQFPGMDIIPRLYIVHVLLLPGLILALVTGHLFAVWHQGHTQWAGPKRREDNEYGPSMFPIFMMKTTSLFIFVFAALALLGTIAQINPVWLFGPYNPAISSNGSQPDWYFSFVEGAMRLMPSADWNFLGHTVVWSVFLAAVVMPVVFFVLMGSYPFFERWVTGDARYHHLLDRPRNMPARTALGVAVVTQAIVLQLAAADDLIAYHFSMPVEDVVWTLRGGFFIAPPLAFWVAAHVCVALQRADRRRLRAGLVTGISARAAEEPAAAGPAAEGPTVAGTAAEGPTVAGTAAAADGAGPARRVPGQRATPERTAADGQGLVGYTAVSAPLPEENRIRLSVRRPDELITPIPRHLVPLPTPRRTAAQVRARLNHLFLLSRLEHPPLDGTAQADGANHDGTAGRTAGGEGKHAQLPARSHKARGTPGTAGRGGAQRRDARVRRRGAAQSGSQRRRTRRHQNRRRRVRGHWACGHWACGCRVRRQPGRPPQRGPTGRGGAVPRRAAADRHQPAARVLRVHRRHGAADRHRAELVAAGHDRSDRGSRARVRGAA